MQLGRELDAIEIDIDVEQGIGAYVDAITTTRSKSLATEDFVESHSIVALLYAEDLPVTSTTVRIISIRPTSGTSVTSLPRESN